MPATLLLFTCLLTQIPAPLSAQPKAVLVELRNGSHIEGTLLDEEPGVWVIGVSGGEMRLAKKSVLRVVPKEAPQTTDSPAAQPDVPPAPTRAPAQVTVDLPSPAPMSFQVPDAWTEKKLEGRDLALTDPTQSLLFGVTTVNDPHSLWNFTRAIKKDYQRLYEGFAVEREKFSATSSLRSWEVEFRYRKENEEFREVHLMLDFGETKRIFSFTASAQRFEDLFPRFRSVVNTFAFPVATPPDCEGGANLAA